MQNLATFAAAVPEMIAGIKIENGSYDPNYAPFRGALSSVS